MRSFKIIKEYNSDSGNVSILSIFIILLFAVLFLVLGDMCRIFVVREITKKAADAVSLAISQDVLFFNTEESINNAEMIAENNSCQLTDLKITYNRVLVTVEKKLDFIFLKRLYPNGCTVYSSSCSRVTFPWDDCFEYCDCYKFNY